MSTQIDLEILPQPDETTCGPTCLQAVYNHYGLALPLERVIAEVSRLEEGGTLGAFMGCHALRQGYAATMFTFNLEVFDPTWFGGEAVNLAERLEKQLEFKSEPRFQKATSAYREFIQLGGRVRLEDLKPETLRRYLRESIPILAGLSATWLYGTAREFGPKMDYDDLRGTPAGHFVVLCGYNRETRTVTVADPLSPNPAFDHHTYEVGIDRLVTAILLGILTYDANLLIIEPGRTGPSKGNENQNI